MRRGEGKARLSQRPPSGACYLRRVWDVIEANSGVPPLCLVGPVGGVEVVVGCFLIIGSKPNELD